jgi:hypothetical protein
MPAPRKFDEETSGRARCASTLHVGYLLDINPATLRARSRAGRLLARARGTQRRQHAVIVDDAL